MFARTLSMSQMVEAQLADGVWYVVFQPIGFLVYMVSALGETNRAPFDLPEAESELVAGYHTEYSGFRWALFFMAEYSAMIVTSAVAVTLFLGGWSLFGLEERITPFIFGILVTLTFIGLAVVILVGARGSKSKPARTVGFASALLFVLLGAAILPLSAKFLAASDARTLFSIGVFAGKICALIYAYMWFRWTWPRYRYDQLMELGWKWMIPAALINIVLTGVLYVLALPASQGGVFGFLRDVRGRLVPAGLSAKAYFIGTAFLISIPISWMVLAAINRRSRDFNLHEQRQLQIKLRRERLEKRADTQPAEQP
jgi:NADH-quinone oxidoreductase subunit H